MTRSIIFSFIFHLTMIILTALSLPFMMRAPIDLPPILSVELIQEFMLEEIEQLIMVEY